MNDQLTTMLREAATHQALPPAPPAHVRRHAEKVRDRRRAAAAVAGVAAAAAVVLASQGTLSGVTWSWDAVGPANNKTPGPVPTSLASPDASTPAPSPSASTSNAPDATEDASGGPVNTTGPWPAPPTGPVAAPWTQPGFDAGRIVAARMEDGHAVITVDRIQFYSAEQWRTTTGESIDTDFRSVNESTRTRQFVIEDDAVISVNWQYGETAAPARLTPRELVDRTTAVLLEQAVSDRERKTESLATPGEPPSVEVFLFHRDGLDGPVAYLEDVGKYTG
jgi:hypothetical protein